jgi:hypothetical protein
MSKVFRRIRQRLLAENKVTRYLLYAIGEIVLVVIGILIALQINNKSEYNKERKIEVLLLENLSSEVNLDIMQIENNTQQSTLRLQRLDSLVRSLNDPNKIDNTSFLNKSYDFVIDNYFTSNSGIFDEAVSSGKMSYIENEKLRQKIFDYYRVARNSYTDGTTRQITDEIITPLMIESLFLNTDGLSMIASDVKNTSSLNNFNPELLAKNKDFWRMVLLKFGGNKEQMIKWQLLKKEAEKLKEQIDQELTKLKDD